MICKYIVAKAGDINRDETINVAVLMWRDDDGDASPVHARFLKDWSRLLQSFRWSTDEMQNEILSRLSQIKTKEDYKLVLSKMGPYTPFEFTEERASVGSPEAVIDQLATFFLVEP